MPFTDFVPPKDTAEARERRRMLVAEVEEISAQLGNPLKEKEMGEELFLEWRQKAKWALTNRLQHIRLIKQWFQDTTQDGLCPTCGLPVEEA